MLLDTMSFYYNNSPPSGSSAAASAVYYNGMTSVNAASSPGSSIASDGTAAVTQAAQAAAHSRVASYSRPSSVSPQMSQAYPVYMTSRARFNASRGFEAEDDLEFCPALMTEREVIPVDIDKSPMSPSISPVHHTHYSSAAAVAASGSPNAGAGGGRVRRAIQIVNPNTGMRVGSPKR